MNLTTAIFLIASALLLGVALGGIIANLRLDMKSNARASESQPGDLMRLRKDADSGALVVWVAEKSFNSVDEMNPVQRTLAGYVVNDLSTWLSRKSPAEAIIPPAAPAVTIPVVEPVDVPVAAVPNIADVPLPQAVYFEPASSATSSQLGNQPSEGQLTRRRGSLFGVLRRALVAEVPSTRVVSKSIAVEVNEILQRKLKNTPLEERGICLMELPGNEMVVLIGIDKYDSVNSVPDDEIRTMLQSAVNEWLARST